MYAQRKIVEIVESLSSGIEKSSDVVCQPEGPENIHGGFASIPSDIGLRDEHRDIWRQAVVTPDLENVAHQRRFVVQTAPTDLARFVGIMLKGEKGQVLNTAVRFQVIQKTSRPGNFSLGVRPHHDIFILTGINRSP